MPRRRRRRKYYSHDPVLSKGIIAVLLFILAIIIGLSFFDKAGTIGVILDQWVLSFLFGSIRYAAPFVIGILAWFLIRDIEYNYRATHLFGAILFFLSLSSIMHIGFDTTDMWRQALEGHGGGVFGMLAWPLKTYLGTIAGIVLLVGLGIVAFLLIFNTAITHFILFHRKLMEGMGWFGAYLVRAVTTLFVRNGEMEDEEEYDEDEDDDEEYEDEDDEDEDERSFSKKYVDDEDDEEYEDDDEDEDDDEEPIVTPTSRQGTAGPPTTHSASYTQNVIIRPIPPVSLLSSKKGKPTSGDIKANSKIIEDTLAEFNINVTMGEARVGPTVTQFSFKPSKGVKLSRITTLANDLALALAAHPIRIEAPIPGKSLVGIEVPNQKAAMVTFKELLQNKEFKNRDHNMMIALGKDVAGKVWFADLPRMPHLLIAGATGSGKTVCVNTIIMSLLFQNTAETLRMIMVDPKRVELTMYNGIPHLLTPVITKPKQTVNALNWTISEMDRRFELLAQRGCRDINSFNKKNPNEKLPHIVFVIDELADLMATTANEVEAGIIRLAQMARAVGIHLLVATQRPSVDVITGLMKANIPGRVAFSVASIVDSRTILDAPGAEKLLGRGDMLYSSAELSKPIRIQGAYISEQELKKVVRHLKGKEKPQYDPSITEKGGGTASMFGGASDDHDPLFEEAKKLILDSGKASASFLQRRLRVGYARAARILDELEEAGIIGPSQGAKPREILVTKEEAYAKMNSGGEFNVYSDEEEAEEEDELDVDEEELDEELEEELDDQDDDEDDLEEDEEYEDELDDEEEEEELDDEDDEDYEEEEEELDDEDDLHEDDEEDDEEYEEDEEEEETEEEDEDDRFSY